MKNIIVLEDNMSRVGLFKEWFSSPEVFEHSGACISYLRTIGKMPIDILFLDHDLDGKAFVDSSEKNTGMEVVRFLVSHNELSHQILRIIIHSLNIPAAREMKKELLQVGYNVSRIPFTLIQHSIYKEFIHE